MPKRLSPRERFEQLVSTYEPAVRLAFLDAIDDITSNIVLRRVVERLERGDINGAVAAMHLDPAAFRPLDEVIRQAFNGGGVATGEQMPALKDPEGNRVVVRFDIRNIEAVNWLREHSTTLMTNMNGTSHGPIRDIRLTPAGLISFRNRCGLVGLKFLYLSRLPICDDRNCLGPARHPERHA